jgi:hypothetical protein
MMGVLVHAVFFWRIIMIAESHKEFDEPIPSTEKSLFQLLASWATKAGDCLFKVLLTEQNAEPTITPLQNCDNEVFWKIYDSRTGKKVYCMSEHEVMVWLDSRNYRQ